MSYVLDTNILTRMAEDGHPMQAEAVAAVEKLLRKGEQLCLLPQTVYEFWVVATRPREQNGIGLSAEGAEGYVVKYLSVFELYADNHAVFTEWRNLIARHAIIGKRAHDARIVAAMIAHGLSNLVTFNKDDFKHFQPVTALLPSEI